MSGATALACRGLAKSFDGVAAVVGFDLDVPQGSVVTLLGPSGCGKTTALRLIAGLERPDAGTIDVGGRRVSDGDSWIPPERRRVGMVFQESALFPHLDVAANIAFGIDDDRTERVDYLLGLAQLDGLAHRMPHELSGGQQQRVALARALAPHPEMLLLDEPFSNLDAQLRAEVRSQVREMLDVTETTAVFVTHDQEEALSISDHVAVMIDGTIRQFGSPEDIYDAPTDARVARIAGQANVVSAIVDGGIAGCAIAEVPAPGFMDGPCMLMVRPEWLEIRLDEHGVGVIASVEFFGHDRMVRCVVPEGDPIDARVVGQPELVVGARVSLAVRRSWLMR